MADASSILRRALALHVPRPAPVMGFDHDPFAHREGRTPLRRGQPLDRSKVRFVPGPAPLQPRKEPTMATDTTTTTPDAEIVSKLKDYLQSILTSEQWEDVQSILAGGDVQAPPVMAGDRARRAADAEAHALDFAKRFPNAARLKPGFR